MTVKIIKIHFQKHCFMELSIHWIGFLPITFFKIGYRNIIQMKVKIVGNINILSVTMSDHYRKSYN